MVNRFQSLLSGCVCGVILSVMSRGLILQGVILHCVILHGVGSAEASSAGLWKAGAAKTVITPSAPVWMAGYASRSGPSEGVMVDLHARAIALSDPDGHRIVIVGLELIEIPQGLREAVLVRAKERYGLGASELLLNVSHTHGGPMVSGKTVRDWGIGAMWAERAEGYARELVDKVDATIGEAIRRSVPAVLGHGVARCGFAMNRRLPSDGGIRLAPNPEGVVDHDVPWLSVRSADGKLIATLFGYACHNTALSDTRELNGDYAGFAQRDLERSHPDATAIFLTGCGGDQDPSPRRDRGDAERNAGLLAEAVEGGLRGEAIGISAKLATSLRECEVEFAPLPSREELERRAGSGDGFVSRHARWVMETWPRPGDRPEPYKLPVQVVMLGDRLLLVALGGEPVADYAIRIKRELASLGRSVWVAGYSNRSDAYIPSRRVLLEGGYEGTDAVIYQSLPAPFAIDIEERIVRAVRDQATRLGASGQ